MHSKGVVDDTTFSVIDRRGGTRNELRINCYSPSGGIDIDVTLLRIDISELALFTLPDTKTRRKMVRPYRAQEI